MYPITVAIFTWLKILGIKETYFQEYYINLIREHFNDDNNKSSFNMPNYYFKSAIARDLIQFNKFHRFLLLRITYCFSKLSIDRYVNSPRSIAFDISINFGTKDDRFDLSVTCISFVVS